MRSLVLLRLTLQDSRRRIAGLAFFAALALGAALLARTLVYDQHGHTDLDQLFVLGGYPGVSALLLLGWLLGRFPLIATLVLMAGLVSADRENGLARILAVRPMPPLRIYAMRFAALATVAFVLSASLLITFDLLLLGTWAGPATFVLVLAYIMVYGGVVALLSVLVRGDAWIALLIAIAAMLWDALRQTGVLEHAPDPARTFITALLPPHAALFGLEGAFAGIEPIPWDLFGIAAGYGILALSAAAVILSQRQV